MAVDWEPDMKMADDFLIVAWHWKLRQYLLFCRCVRNGNYDEALDLEAFVCKLSTMHPKWVMSMSFPCQMNYFFHLLCERKLTWNLFISERLPVIQALATEVRQTTQSLLSQLLQKLRSNIQVSCSSQIKCKYSRLWDVEQNAIQLFYAKDWILIA